MDGHRDEITLNQQPTISSKTTSKWVMIVLLLFFPPIAFYLMWREKEYHKWFANLLILVGGLTSTLGIIQTLFITPKLLELYKDFNTEIPTTRSLLTYTLIIFGIIELIFGFYLNNKLKIELVTKRLLGLAVSFLLLTYLFGGYLQAKSMLSVITPLYNLTSELSSVTPKISQNTSNSPLDLVCKTNKDCPYAVVGKVDLKIPKNPAYCDSGTCRQPQNQSEWDEVLSDYETFVLSVVGADAGGHIDVLDGNAVPVGFINKIFCSGNKMDDPNCPFHTQNVDLNGNPLTIISPLSGDVFHIGEKMTITWTGGPNYQKGRALVATLFRSDNPQIDSNPWNSKENPYFHDTTNVLFDGRNSGQTSWVIPNNLPNIGYGNFQLTPADNYYIDIGCGYGFICETSPKVGPISILE